MVGMYATFNPGSHAMDQGGPWVNWYTYKVIVCTYIVTISPEDMHSNIDITIYMCLQWNPSNPTPLGKKQCPDY